MPERCDPSARTRQPELGKTSAEYVKSPETPRRNDRLAAAEEIRFKAANTDQCEPGVTC